MFPWASRCGYELSGHAGQRELLKWIEPLVPSLKKVSLVQGAPPQSETPQPAAPLPPARHVEPVRRVTPLRIRSGSILGLDIGRPEPPAPDQE